MSKMYEGAEIVNVEYVRDPGGTDSAWFVLGIETKCSFHLAQNLTIPDDPKIFREIDIPAYDGRSVEQWLRDVKNKAVN